MEIFRAKLMKNMKQSNKDTSSRLIPNPTSITMNQWYGFATTDSENWWELGAKITLRRNDILVIMLRSHTSFLEDDIFMMSKWRATAGK